MEKAVLITGGTSGIGLATAKKFLIEGYKVCVVSVDGKAVVETAMKELEALGEVRYLRADVSCEEEAKAAIEQTVKIYGRIDVLCNIAGIVGDLTDPIEADLSEVERIFKINTMGSIYMAVYAARYMKEQGKGVIINTSSICGFLATNNGLGYHVSKGGINMATKVMAKDWGKYGIRCVAIAPGTVRTKLMDDFKDVPDFEKIAFSYHMKNRVIEPQEIANAVYLLSLDEASAINGSVVMTEDGFCSFKGVF